MTLFRGTFLDAPEDPFAGGELRADEDAALLVRDGEITERGAWSDLRRRHPLEEVTDLTEGLVLPGFVDTHVHLPQVRVIGGLGMPLLDWLDRCALPEEARMSDPGYAAGVAADFVRGLAQAGTTSALVFGAHYAPAVDLLFAEASRVGLRIAGGLVLGDRTLPPELRTTPEQARADSLALAERWHGTGRARYAVTPRFSLSCTDELLAVCGELLEAVPGALFTSHVNENPREIEAVAELFDGSHYVGTYHQHGLLGTRSVLAHNVHPSTPELELLGETRTAVAHCPTSNAALASGLFPMARHLRHGVPVALGSDVGAGTGPSLYKEGLQAYFAQQLLGPDGHPLRPVHLLHLATAAGARALGLDRQVGDFAVGKRFDAQWLRPSAGTGLDVSLRHAPDADQALARAFALGTSADVAAVWVDGERVDTRAPVERAGQDGAGETLTAAAR